MKISAAMGRRLLRKHCVGDFGRGSWSTIAALLKVGALAEVGDDLVVTPAGRAWCDANHMNVSLGK